MTSGTQDIRLPVLPPLPPHSFLGDPDVLRPSWIKSRKAKASSETQTSIPSSNPTATLTSRPPCTEMVSLFPDALAAPRYLVLGGLRCLGSPRSPEGRAGPPSPRPGLGGPLRPVAQLDFPTQTLAPPAPQSRPLLVVPPLLALKSLSSAPPRLQRALLAQRQCWAGYRGRVRGSGCSLSGPPPIPAYKPQFHLDPAPFQCKPRPLVCLARRFRPHPL